MVFWQTTTSGGQWFGQSWDKVETLAMVLGRDPKTGQLWTHPKTGQ
jgi:hypothetical protein